MPLSLAITLSHNTPAVAPSLLQVFHVFSRKMSRLPELIRQQRKRALGQPRTGRMSLVMTDIQGFTNLMQGDADQTTQVCVGVGEGGRRGGGGGEGFEGGGWHALVSTRA